MTIHVPQAVVSIIEEFEKSHFQCYIVGGIIRDSILQTQDIKHDWDLATSAKPEMIRKIFRNDKLITYGERHGTIVVRRKGINYEITTFREEEGYTDGRRPDKVKFVNKLESDLSRRDFTINALAADKNGNIIDLFGGIDDIKHGIIRCVGDPATRLIEDSLRIFRAIRFAVRYGFSIHPDTEIAIYKHNKLIIEHKLSGERIFTELNEIIKYTPEGINYIYQMDLMKLVYPSFSEDISDNILNQTSTKQWDRIKKRSLMRNWAYLCSFITQSKNNKQIFYVIKSLFKTIPGMNKRDQEYIFQLIRFQQFMEIILSHGPSFPKLWIGRKILKYINSNNLKIESFTRDLIELYYLIIPENEIAENLIEKLSGHIKSLSAIINEMNTTLPINGEDIITFGIKGKGINYALKYCRILIDRNLLIDAIGIKRELREFINKASIDLEDLMKNWALENFNNIIELMFEEIRLLMDLLLEVNRYVIINFHSLQTCKNIIDLILSNYSKYIHQMIINGDHDLIKHEKFNLLPMSKLENGEFHANKKKQTIYYINNKIPNNKRIYNLVRKMY